MKKVLLLTVAMLVCASMAFAQAGSIGLYSDPFGANCNLLDNVPGLYPVYVVHVNAPGATASEWAVSNPACLNALFLSDSSPFGVYIGASPFLPSGKAVGYGLCLGSPIHAATLDYFTQALTGPCCLQSVIPHGINGAISVVDCSSNLLSATGGSGIWNPVPGCNCTVGTHDSTWGSVKAMFQ
jgi:hypothetical protein